MNETKFHKHVFTGVICAGVHLAVNAEPTVPVHVLTDDELSAKIASVINSTTSESRGEEAMSATRTSTETTVYKIESAKSDKYLTVREVLDFAEELQKGLRDQIIRLNDDVITIRSARRDTPDEGKCWLYVVTKFVDGTRQPELPSGF